MIPNKLARKTHLPNGRCRGTHKYRRFARNNKTYRLDVYYCANCGHMVKIEEIFGHMTICWGCGKEFGIPAGMVKLMPTCRECSSKDDKRLKYRKNTGEQLEWLEDPKEKEDAIDTLLREVGLK